MNPEFEVGAAVSGDVFPVDLQPTPEEIQMSKDITGTNPVFTVPSGADIIETEMAIESLVADYNRLSAAREAISKSGGKLSKNGVAAIHAATECLCEKISLAEPEAFANGEESAGHFAVEAVEQAQKSILQRIFDKLLQWAREVFLWAQSQVSAGLLAKRQLDNAKRQLPSITHIVLGKNRFFAKRLLPAAVVNEQGIGAGVRDIPRAFADLNTQMRGLVQAASSMFTETPNSETGKWNGIYATGRMAMAIRKDPVFNKDAIGGARWTISTSKTIQEQGGDSIYRFSIDAEVVPSENEPLSIPAVGFRPIILAVENALKESTNTTKLLKSYASGIGGIRAAFGRDIDNGLRIMEAAISASNALRFSAKTYNRIIHRAAGDINSCVNNASFK